MSQENVEIVRAHIEAFNRLDGSALAFFDPHVVLDRSRVTGLDFGPPQTALQCGVSEMYYI